MTVDGLILKLRKGFEQIKDHRAQNCQYKLADNLMAGFSIFHQKDPSLLAFREQFAARSQNMRQIYGLEMIPEDTGLRKCLDGVDPAGLQGCFSVVLGEAKSAGVLDSKRVFGGRLCVTFDGTGEFSSSAISCPHCLVKKHRNGKTTCHHQLLGAVLVHPEQATVLPVYAEAIVNSDGAKKNDCERNALKRLLPKVRQMLDNEPIVAVLDGLYADGPTIRALAKAEMDYLIGIKEGYVLVQVEALDKQDKLQSRSISDPKATCRFRWANGLVLNGANQQTRVNYLEFEQTETKTGRLVYKNTWITNIEIDAHNVEQLVKVGRSRWKIENETFNTLKNQGYHMEHNYGHGSKFLSTVFAMLMLLAFATDQLAQAADNAFIKARAVYKTNKAFFKRINTVFDLIPSMSMNAIFRFIAGDIAINFPKIE